MKPFPHYRRIVEPQHDAMFETSNRRNVEPPKRRPDVGQLACAWWPNIMGEVTGRKSYENWRKLAKMA